MCIDVGQRVQTEEPTMKRWMLVVGLMGASTMLGCSASGDAESEGDDKGVDGPFEAVPQELGEVTSGPYVAPGASTEAWSATNAWTDTSTAEAKKAGVAWDASSGLTWEAKYVRWIQSFKKIPGDRYGSTIEIPTPYGGRTIRGPVLECAEVGMFLRIAFSSWYHLPFFLTGWDAKAKRPLYAGHFGIVNGNGEAIAGFPRFKTQYADAESRWKEGQTWPTDAGLRKARLGQDDENPWLTKDGAIGGGGAYFDEIFLNKRAGRFAVLVLQYFGSVNLADPSNLINIKAESTSAGDVLLERFQKNGIGHTIPVLSVRPTSGGHFGVSVASGSMPRRQPMWQDTDETKYVFSSDYTGGTGNAYDGTPYAKLGGGIKRWRIATSRGGRWYNEVAPADKADYIESTNIAAISERPEKFKDLLSDGTPEEQKAAAIKAIETARQKLRDVPASCSTRTAREEAFGALYDVESKHFNKSKADVDKEFRTLEDHVFAELEYTKSKTCCWNTTTTAMSAIVLDFAQKEQAAAEAAQQCKQPTVFRSQTDGYAKWSAHASSMGKSSDWRSWSEDEPCAQRAVAEDTIAPRGKVDFCAAN
jgi:hypothetical protein